MSNDEREAARHVEEALTERLAASEAKLRWVQRSTSERHSVPYWTARVAADGLALDAFAAIFRPETAKACGKVVAYAHLPAPARCLKRLHHRGACWGGVPP